MDTEKLIKEVLHRKTWLLKENSNTQMSPSLLDLHISSQANEEYALKNLYSKEVARHHREGSIYIHTLHTVLKPYCLPEDSVLIFKDEVGVKVDQVKNLVKNFQNQNIRIYTPDGFKNLEGVYEKDVNGVEKFIKITTSDGVIWVTGEHRIITEKGIKKADEISENDVLFKLRKSPPLSGNIEYIDIEEKIQNEEIKELEKIFINESHVYTRVWKFPKKLKITNELATFIGLYIAEGHHRFQNGKNNDIVITCGDDEVLNWLREFANIYGLNCSVSTPPSKTRQIYVGSGLWFVLKYGFGIRSRNAGEKKIPSLMFNVPSEHQNALLRGLFSGDGGLIVNYNQSQILVSYTTVSKILAQQLYILLLSRGFSPRIIVEKPFVGKGNVSNKDGIVYGKKELYRILLSGYSNAEHFCRTIGFIDKKRMRMLREYLESHSKNGTQWIEAEKELLNNQLNGGVLPKRIGRTERAIQEQLRLVYSLGLHKKIEVKKVEEIEKYGNSVYDLQIESPHTFYTGLGGILVHNCNGIDARVFLLDGLRFPHCRSAPAKHFSSAVYQSMAFLFYSQLFFSGAQAYDYYNWFLAPYLHYDKIDYEEIKQTLQGFVFQLNQSNRTGAQSAFTNIGMRIQCPSYLKEIEGEPVHVIYAGRKQKETYEEFEDEARTIYKALMEVMGEGDGSGAPFTFPLITTAITKDFDWNDELVDVTMETASRTGAPYFFNLAADYLDEKYVHAMCCRLLVEHSGGIWMAGGLGTGSNKVVTLNLPHIALISKNESEFFSDLDKALEVARKALLESNAIIKKSLDEWDILPFLKQKTENGAPYYNFEERRLTFGMIGMNECLLNLIDKPLVSEEGLELGLKIIAHMAAKADKFSKEDNVVYTLEQTPAESATFKLATKDRQKFGKKAHVQGVGEKIYYTNSTHVPYNADVSLTKKIKTEAEFHPFFTGGTICHIWMGESRPYVSGLKAFVKNLSKTKLAYFAFSPDFSICRNDHFSRGKLQVCPRCEAEIVDHINRIVGYFTRTSNWNPGKHQEYEERRRFSL
jgi:ribonucleoside-triphosphate reductase